MTRAILFILLAITTSNLWGQKDSIILFTKAACNNCKFTKHRFSSHGIAYTEYSLDDNTNAPLLYKRLTKAGHQGKINLPVMFLNETIWHPTKWEGDSLTRPYMPHLIDSIIVANNKGLLDLPKIKKETPKPSTIKVSHETEEDDCEYEEKSIYLACGTFTELDEALAYINELVAEGFNDANYMDYKGRIRVYTNIYKDPNQANVALQKMRKSGKLAYLLKIDD